MADINWLLAEIETGPQGPTVGAFFDFDGTLIKGYSATAFFKERIKTRDVDAKEVFQTLVESINIERHGKDVTDLMNIAVQAQAGKTLRWHIDYLLDEAAVAITGVVAIRTMARLEGALVERLLAQPGVVPLAPGLGGSDDRGRSHLLVRGK